MRLEQDGIAPDMLSAEELATMFMPQEVRKGTARLAGFVQQPYFSTELAEYHKDEVRVSYDLSDASAVNVFDMDGKFITKAQANGNTREAFPTARIDQLAEKRRKGKIKRAEKCNQARKRGSQSGFGTGCGLGRAGTFGRKRHRGGVCGIAENGHGRFCAIRGG